MKNIIIILTLIFIQGCVGYNNYKFTQKAKENNQPLVIKSFYPTYPNSAGGVSIYPIIENISDKAIKYISITVTPYDTVGEQAFSEIRNESTEKLKMTGPFKPGYDTTGFLEGFSQKYFSNVWYNYHIKCVELNSIEITFMDNSTMYYDKENVSLITTQNMQCINRF